MPWLKKSGLGSDVLPEVKRYTVPMRLFDTHCHLDFPVFDHDREALLKVCRRLGIERILLPGVEAAHWCRLLELGRRFPELEPALGLHPGFVSSHRDEDLQRLERLLGGGHARAVGEIGLDFWKGREDEARQAHFFEAQLDMAKKHRLPVLLHVRKAHDQVLMRLRRWQLPRGGVAHAFSGSDQQAEQYIELGFRLGIGGALTYPRAKRLRRQVCRLPLRALVLETDAPDMPLCGRQGQRNRPGCLIRVLETLAELRDEPLEQVADQLWRNSLDLTGEALSS